MFEGFFVRYVFTYNPKGNRKSEDTYTIKSYQVQKVYKGDQSLTGELVYVVLQGGTLGMENWEINNNEYYFPTVLEKNNLSNGVNAHTPCVFFCFASDFPDDVNSKYYSYKKYKRLGDNIGNKFLDFMYVCEGKIIGLNDLVFHHREDFYNYMRRLKNFIVPETTPVPEKQPIREEAKKAVLDSAQYEVIKEKWGDI